MNGDGTVEQMIRKTSGGFDPRRLRGDFPILNTMLYGSKKLVYLDNAATTQKPASMVCSMCDYYQAINADAPNPAAARLWQEWLYSDEGQNLWLKGGARPIRMDAMTEAGTIDEAAAAALPEVTGTPIVPSQADAETGKQYLAENWANAVG